MITYEFLLENWVCPGAADPQILILRFRPLCLCVLFL